MISVKLKKGDEFTERFVIDDEIYDGFISIFKDRNPMHTDKKYAVDKGFEDVIMHGNILNGFISYFVGEKLPIKNVIIHKQSIKYKKPVYKNEELAFRAYVSDVFDSVNAVEFKFTFMKQDGTKAAVGKIQIGTINSENSKS